MAQMEIQSNLGELCEQIWSDRVRYYRDRFLNAFDELHTKLLEVENHAMDLHEHCEGIRYRLRVADETTSQFVLKAGNRREERETIGKCAELMSGFLQKFQLSEEQLHALQEEPLEDDEGASFFSALDHGHAIRESCKSLLTSAHQSAGSELRNAMADHQESAYARLYQWVPDHCQDLEGDSLSIEEKKNPGREDKFFSPRLKFSCFFVLKL
jgi:hypothetical protein